MGGGDWQNFRWMGGPPSPPGKTLHNFGHTALLYFVSGAHLLKVCYTFPALCMFPFFHVGGEEHSLTLVPQCQCFLVMCVGGCVCGGVCVSKILRFINCGGSTWCVGVDSALLCLCLCILYKVVQQPSGLFVFNWTAIFVFKLHFLVKRKERGEK